MNDQRTSYMALRINIFGTTDLCLGSDCLHCEKNWTHTPSASGSYSRLAGGLADKIQVDFKFFKIFYRLNY